MTRGRFNALRYITRSGASRPVYVVLVDPDSLQVVDIIRG